MTGIRWFSAIVLGVILTADASAQFLPYPPAAGIPVLVPNGLDFSYRTRNARVAGFIPTGGASIGVLPVGPTGGYLQPYYPYYPTYPPVILGAVENNTTLQIFNPPGVGYQRRSLAPYMPDVSGIDLDEESPSKIWGKKPGAPKVAAAKEAAPKKAEAAKIELPQERNAPANLPKQPKMEVVPADQRLLETGTAAFRNGDYGIAIMRFRQLSEADPPVTRAMFLQAQAYIAVGKYKEAIQLLQQGLKRQPNWHQSEFRPKADLYGKDEELWKQHVNRLEKAQRQQPKNAEFLFLLGYMSWFDGEKDAAVDYFQQARALTFDTQWADLFLKAAAAKVGAK
jgi:hypothetical protein